jgi:hypothetical protein
LQGNVVPEETERSAGIVRGPEQIIRPAGIYVCPIPVAFNA